MKSRIQQKNEVKAKYSIFEKIMISILIIVCAMLVYEGIIALIAFRKIDCNYINYDNTGIKIEYNIKDCPYNNRAEVKQDIDKLFGNTPYIYVEKNLGDRLGGDASPIIRMVRIHNDLPIYEYTFTLAHELIHITHCTLNETYTQFEAFKILYESGNEWFKNCALWEVKYRMGSGTVYDFGYYVIEYLGLKEK